MTTYLLDVNVLLALSDPMHLHHEVAHRWFSEIGQNNWATCPITENGFVRIASHPHYPNRPGDAQVVLALLRQFCEQQGHEFWSDSKSLREMLGPAAAVTHSQITDLYLLGLALHHNGKLATLDQQIPHSVIKGGESALEMIVF